MRYECVRRSLADGREWDDFDHRIVNGYGKHQDRPLGGLLGGLLGTFRGLSARCCLDEYPYIDRDFSALYSAFYATLYRSFPKHCRRIHFFGDELADFKQLSVDPAGRAAYLERHRENYLGYIVLRPLRHAPVSSAIVSADHFSTEAQEICIRAEYRVHLLGAELSVTGAAITEQDKLNGVCAQAAMWMAHRHQHNKHSSPWLATPEINRAALMTLDARSAQSLPAGSETLGADNMAMALREGGEHPLVYVPGHGGGSPNDQVLRTVTRYLDSGLPVILGLRGATGGHSVMAVGLQRSKTEPPAVLEDDKAHEGEKTEKLKYNNAADRVTHILVNDDQRGAYVSIPVGNPTGADRYGLANADVVFVLLPKKVHMTAEHAEHIARESVAKVWGNRRQHAIEALGDHYHLWKDEVDPAFSAGLKTLVARTYLTSGWKYKHRIVRSEIRNDIKNEVLNVQLPRYVWVTELALPGDAPGLDRTAHRVRAHVVVDATGSPYWGSIIITHVPGVAVLRVFDPADLRSGSKTVTVVFQTDSPYMPKIRGWPGVREEGDNHRKMDGAAEDAPGTSTSADSVEGSDQPVEHFTRDHGSDPTSVGALVERRT